MTYVDDLLEEVLCVQLACLLIKSNLQELGMGGRVGGRVGKRGGREGGGKGERKRVRGGRGGCIILEGPGNEAVSLIVKFSLTQIKGHRSTMSMSHDQIYIT